MCQQKVPPRPPHYASTPQDVERLTSQHALDVAQLHLAQDASVRAEERSRDADADVARQKGACEDKVCALQVLVEKKVCTFCTLAHQINYQRFHPTRTSSSTN